MKEIFLTVVLFTLAACLSVAQAAPANPNTAAAQAPTNLTAGSILPVELSKTLDAKKAHTGDPVRGKIPHDLSSNGKVVIPQDAKVLGHIAEAKASTHDDKNSMLGIVFDKIVVKDGTEIPLTAEIQAIGAPMGNGSSAMSENAPPAQNNPTGVNQNSQMGTPRNVGAQNMPGDPGVPSGPSAPPLTASTQGVVGMPGFSLSQGQMKDSVVSSQEHNVKLESGTQILLRTK